MDGQVAEVGETQGDLVTDNEAGDLVRVYYAIPETQRGRFLDLARSLSAAA